MNIFSILFSNLIFVLFPLFIYIIFLTSNNGITTKTKSFLFDIILASTIYIVFNYSDNSIPIINFLFLNSIVLIAYIKKRIIIANIVAILIILLYYNYFNMTQFMLIPYIALYSLYYIKNKYNMTEYMFIDLFILFQYLCLVIWIMISNKEIYLNLGLINILVILLLNYITIHIIYQVYNHGERIIIKNIKYKEIKKECKIKTSLFKITHEIKNPIAVIKAYLDMLDVNDKQQINKYIPIIKSEIDRLLNLLQDFLLVNKANVSFDLMDINMLIEDIIKREIPLMNDKKIKFDSNLIDDEIYINGDYNRLQQVLVNIIKNSIEAIDNNKGTITIKDVIKNNDINIIIEDNGVGISKKILSKIKEPFYTTKNRGTGLGVSLSDEIIKAHNGSLEYRSLENIGTKVTIKLPLYGKE